LTNLSISQSFIWLRVSEEVQLGGPGSGCSGVCCRQPGGHPGLQHSDTNLLSDAWGRRCRSYSCEL